MCLFAGTITCMEFYKSTHLLTGSEDHTVCIWRVHDWALLHVLGGHKAAVTSLRCVARLVGGHGDDLTGWNGRGWLASW